MEYVPHVLMHRYARNQNEMDQKKSKLRFIDEMENKNVSKAFLCHIEKNKSHAFAVIKDTHKDQWLLLDSLKDDPLPLPNLSILFEDYHLGGRASVVIFEDTSSSRSVIWENTKEIN